MARIWDAESREKERKRIGGDEWNPVYLDEILVRREITDSSWDLWDYEYHRPSDWDWDEWQELHDKIKISQEEAEHIFDAAEKILVGNEKIMVTETAMSQYGEWDVWFSFRVKRGDKAVDLLLLVRRLENCDEGDGCEHCREIEIYWEDRESLLKQSQLKPRKNERKTPIVFVDDIFCI